MQIDTDGKVTVVAPPAVAVTATLNIKERNRRPNASCHAELRLGKVCFRRK